MSRRPVSELDVRDRLIDAALRVAETEEAISALTRQLRSRPCVRPVEGPGALPCWRLALGWGDGVAVVSCAACAANRAMVAERRRLRRGLGARRGALRRAATAFRGSLWYEGRDDA